MTTLQATLFVEDVESYKNMLDAWLGGSVLDDDTSEESGHRSVLYNFEGAIFGFTQVSDKTNTALKTNGGTAALRFAVESRDRVDALCKKAIDAGLTAIGEAMEFKTDESSLYMVVLEDKEKHYWHIAHFQR